jgi:hypothetical protein
MFASLAPTETIIARSLASLLVVAILMIWLLGTPAYAIVSDPLKLAESTADTYWGQPPCGGSVQVQWQQNVPSSAISGSEVEAWVSFDTSIGMDNFAAPASQFTDCVLNINSNLWTSSASVIEGYPWFCQMIIHEFGHLTDHQHVTDPANVMYPVFTEWNMPAACKYDISAGTGLAPNGFPPLPGSSPKALPASRLRVKSGCFEIGCSGSAKRPRKKAAFKGSFRG